MFWGVAPTPPKNLLFSFLQHNHNSLKWLWGTCVLAVLLLAIDSEAIVQFLNQLTITCLRPWENHLTSFDTSSDWDIKTLRLFYAIRANKKKPDYPFDNIALILILPVCNPVHSHRRPVWTHWREKWTLLVLAYSTSCSCHAASILC
jgi:hypothetical protein